MQHAILGRMGAILDSREQGTRSMLPLQFTSSKEGAILSKQGAILGGKGAILVMQ
jgi:hypothetical protein